MNNKIFFKKKKKRPLGEVEPCRHQTPVMITLVTYEKKKKNLGLNLMNNQICCPAGGAVVEFWT